MKKTSLMPELSDRSLQEIEKIGRLRIPTEACGLLLEIPHTDSTGRTTRVLEIPNRSPLPHNSYVMDSDDIRLVMEGKPDQLVAAWHTHPGGLIGPSLADMRERPPESVPMLVVALTEDGPVPSWF